MEEMFFTRMDSAIGTIMLVGTSSHLRRVILQTGRKAGPPDPAWRDSEAPFREVLRQLREYFSGTRKEFDLPLAPEGTPFQRKVWSELRAIPYGETRTYGEIARRLGNAGASRAVGAANGSNPLSIVVPCHRVIGSNGALTGFGGGLPVKAALLKLEGWRGAGRQAELFQD